MYFMSLYQHSYPPDCYVRRIYLSYVAVSSTATIEIWNTNVS